MKAAAFLLLLASVVTTTSEASDPIKLRIAREHVQEILSRPEPITTWDALEMIRINQYWELRGGYSPTREDRALEKPLFELAQHFFDKLVRNESPHKALSDLQRAIHLGGFWVEHAVLYVMGSKDASDELKFFMLERMGGESAFAEAADRALLQHSEMDAFMRVRFALQAISRLSSIRPSQLSPELAGLCDAMLTRGFVRKREPRLTDPSSR